LRLEEFAEANCFPTEAFGSAAARLLNPEAGGGEG
jgi:hypothetical protein